MMIKLYVNGVNFILLSNVVVEDEIWLFGCNMMMLLRILIVFLLIFVAMFSVWKKDVCDGFILVGFVGIMILIGVMVLMCVGVGMMNC